MAKRNTVKKGVTKETETRTLLGNEVHVLLNHEIARSEGGGERAKSQKRLRALGLLEFRNGTYCLTDRGYELVASLKAKAAEARAKKASAKK
jgi:hypothetical protein